MIPTRVKKFKFYGMWSDDKIEQWLREMAMQGLHMQSVNLLNQYTFVRGEPQDISYRVDYIDVKKADQTYFALFEDAGWEHVKTIVGWQYWRKPCVDGSAPEIFTDNDSKIAKYKRALIAMMICLLPSLFTLLNPSVWATIQREQPFGKHVIASITISLMLIVVYCILRLTLRIRALLNKVKKI